MTSLKIVDAVQELMAKNGSLGEIKASLRSNVISILTNEMEPKANSVAAYAEDETGKLSLSLVRDLLSTLDMKNTLRVFEAESGATHTQLSRENFMKALSLESSPEIEGVPLIDSLISSAKSRKAASSPMAPSAATKAPTTGSSTKKKQHHTNPTTRTSPELSESPSSGSYGLSPEVQKGHKGLSARRAISLEISPKAVDSLPASVQGGNPKSPTALSPMSASMSPSAVDAMQRVNSLTRIPDIETRPRMGRDLAPLVTKSPASTSPTAASILAQKPSIFGTSNEATSPAQEPQQSPSVSPGVSTDSPETKTASASGTISRSDSPTSHLVEGTIRDQKLFNAVKPLNPVSTHVVQVRSNNRRDMRSNATARRGSGSTSRAIRGWGNDDRVEETDFDFGENDKGASPSSPDYSSTVGGANRRLSPLESRLSSPGQSGEEAKAGRFLEDGDDESGQEALEQSMRSNQQDEDYDDDYEDEFESDKSGEVSPQPTTKGGWSAEKEKISPSETKSTALVEATEDFEDAFDDSFDVDSGSPSKHAVERKASPSPPKDTASWANTKRGEHGNIKEKRSPLKEEQNVVIQDLDESVDSEEIVDDFEVSVAENSDSFSFLNESMNSQRSKNKSSKALNMSHTSEGSNVLEFSVTEQELSTTSSAASATDYDLTAKALPPLRNK